MTNEWSHDAERIRELRPRHVLFVCVANSARSQMAATIARALAPPGVRISSAGTQPTPIHPLAIQTLADLGFDLQRTVSRRLDEFEPGEVDVVVTLCADDVGASFPGEALRVHWPLPDPTAVIGSEARRIEAFLTIRDELMRRLAVVFGAKPRRLSV